MKIKPMLVRLQNALGQGQFIEEMVLLPGSVKLNNARTHSDDTINLAIAYNGSANSQAALDLTLWIAHQTRLATRKNVMVHVVHVVEAVPTGVKSGSKKNKATAAPVKSSCLQSGYANSLESYASTATLVKPDIKPGLAWLGNARQQATERCLNLCHLEASLSHSSSLDQADCVLWQARCLAEEWRGSLEAHLRFGSVAEELKQVAIAESADLLFVGCSSAKHPLIKKLTSQFPCPVLGIPTHIEIG